MSWLGLFVSMHDRAIIEKLLNGQSQIAQHKIINENVKMYSALGFSTNSIVRMIYQLEIYSCSNEMKVLLDILSSLYSSMN